MEEKRLYDQSLVYEKRTEPTKQTWTLPAPCVPKVLDIPQAANILHVSADYVTKSGVIEQRLAVTMADRRMIEACIGLDVNGLVAPPDHIETILTQDSPILSWTSVSEHNSVQHIGTTMVSYVFHVFLLPILVCAVSLFIRRAAVKQVQVVKNFLEHITARTDGLDANKMKFRVSGGDQDEIWYA